MLPWLWSAPDRPATPRWLVLLGAGWLISQIITDLVVGSAFEDFARGWAAIVFTITGFAAVMVLVSVPRRARYFALGLAAGGCLGYLVSPNPYAASDPWKWAFALPVGLVIAAGLSGPIGARFRWLTIATFLAFGGMNLILGYRSLGGISLLTAGYLVVAVVAGRPDALHRPSALRVAGGFIILAALTVGVLQLYDVAAANGLLGRVAQSTHAEQAGAFGVLLGGRSEVLASTQAIADSPVLGHGSWAKDFTYVQLLAERRASFGYEIGAGYSDVGLIPTHSYLTQSWVWAGVLGGVFWLAIAGLAGRLLANLYSVRLEMAPLLVFSATMLLWNIAFSPYGSNGRLIAAYGIALCLVGLRATVTRATARRADVGPSIKGSVTPSGASKLGVCDAPGARPR